MALMRTRGRGLQAANALVMIQQIALDHAIPRSYVYVYYRMAQLMALIGSAYVWDVRDSLIPPRSFGGCLLTADRAGKCRRQ